MENYLKKSPDKKKVLKKPKHGLGMEDSKYIDLVVDDQIKTREKEQMDQTVAEAFIVGMIQKVTGRL